MNKIRRVVAVVVAAAMSLSLMCTAAVADQTDTTITLNKKTVYLAVGESTQLTATVSDGQGVDWASLTTSVVQVDEKGRITGLSEGRATVKATAKDGSASANCSVIVYMAFPSYSMREGDMLPMETDIQNGVWTSADSHIASVDGDGNVTANSFGRTYITVEEAGSGRSQSFSITVGGHVGIDISSWNNTIDWQKLKDQGIEFVMIRAGYGWEHTDKRFIENIEGAIAHDMPIGIYFYSYAETAEKAQVEANYCIKLLEPYREHIVLPVAYDLEEYKNMTGAQLTNVAEVFCSALQNAGYHTMVYANSQFLPKMDLTKLSSMGIDYWYAWYQTVPDLSKVRHIVKKNVKPNIWQYSDSCVVQGALASGRTDINVMYMPEYLDISAPPVKVDTSPSGAKITWGGSTYAASYTVHKKTIEGTDEVVGTYQGTVHSCTDQDYVPGTGYYVTMKIRDPLDSRYQATYTSEAIYPQAPEIIMYDVKVTAGEGGTVSGSGSFASGKKATVKAAPSEGYSFDGWFDSTGKKCSDQAAYTFTVTESVTLQARFKKIEKPSTSTGFEDVPDGAWYTEAVQYVVENGLFSGTSDTIFAPQVTMDRAMLVTVLYRQAGSPEASNRNKFVDVSKDAWYARAVTWAYNKGIVTGTGEKTFSPTMALSREQLATILMRYSDIMGMEVPIIAEGDLSVYTDAPEISDYAVKSMEWAVSTQLITGANQKLMPKDGATRAQCATILMRWLESVEP